MLINEYCLSCVTHDNIVIISSCRGVLISQRKEIKGGKVVLRKKRGQFVESQLGTDHCL